MRPYEPADRDACLALFDGNVPAFFAPAERADFAAFLHGRGEDGSFLVVERVGALVACGGFLIEPDGETAGLCWGTVRRDAHRTGLGRRLTEARIAAVRAIPGLVRIRLDTSQHSQGFYARFGFTVDTVTPDAYGPGLDRWDMTLLL